MKISDTITQYFMKKQLKRDYGVQSNVQRGPNGSLFIPSDAPEVPNWQIEGKSDFDKFIKRYGLTAVDKDGNKMAYTMASRGTIESSKDVTMIAPIYKDRFGRTWTVIQEEARPIDIARRGTSARILAFPAGIIGDEAAFQSESAMESAVRELTEETGLKAKKIAALNPYGEIRTTPGLTDEATNYYKAIVEELKPSTKAVTDGGVTRGWHFVPVKRLPEWIEALAKKGKIVNGQTLAAIALMVLSKGRIKI